MLSSLSKICTFAEDAVSVFNLFKLNYIYCSYIQGVSKIEKLNIICDVFVAAARTVPDNCKGQLANKPSAVNFTKCSARPVICTTYQDRFGGRGVQNFGAEDECSRKFGRRKGTCFKCMYGVAYFCCFYFKQLMHKYIYHNTISLYNVGSYMFRHLYVFLRDFQKFVPLQVTFLQFLKLRLLSLQFSKIIRSKYIK